MLNNKELEALRKEAEEAEKKVRELREKIEFFERDVHIFRCVDWDGHLFTKGHYYFAYKAKRPNTYSVIDNTGCSTTMTVIQPSNLLEDVTDIFESFVDGDTALVITKDKYPEFVKVAKELGLNWGDGSIDTFEPNFGRQGGVMIKNVEYSYSIAHTFFGGPFGVDELRHRAGLPKEHVDVKKPRYLFYSYVSDNLDEKSIYIF